jgi:hypothetical protein
VPTAFISFTEFTLCRRSHARQYESTSIEACAGFRVLLPALTPLYWMAPTQARHDGTLDSRVSNLQARKALVEALFQDPAVMLECSKASAAEGQAAGASISKPRRRSLASKAKHATKG